jgi:hypothetical protein
MAAGAWTRTLTCMLPGCTVVGVVCAYGGSCVTRSLRCMRATFNRQLVQWLDPTERLYACCCSKITEAEAAVSVNETKWLVMHVQLKLDELRGPPNPWLTVT